MKQKTLFIAITVLGIAFALYLLAFTSPLVDYSQDVIQNSSDFAKEVGREFVAGLSKEVFY